MRTLGQGRTSRGGRTLRCLGMRKYLLPAALVAALVAAGLYFDLRSSPTHYTLAKTQACFLGAGLKAVPVPNNALPSSEGHLEVTLRRGFGNIYIAFGRDAKEALAVKGRAVQLAVNTLKAHHAGLPRAYVVASVRLKANVFYYSDQGAVTVEAQQTIESCLR